MPVIRVKIPGEAQGVQREGNVRNERMGRNFPKVQQKRGAVEINGIKRGGREVPSGLGGGFANA